MNTGELKKQLTNLLNKIIKMNRLNQRPDISLTTVIKVGVNSDNISSIHSTNEGILFFLTITTHEELFALCTKIALINQKYESADDVLKKVYLILENIQKNKWIGRGIKGEVDKLINNIKNNAGKKRTVIFPIWGIRLENQSFKVGDVEFRRRPVESEIEKDLKMIDEIKTLSTIVLTEAFGDTHMIRRNAEEKINKAINILRAFIYPINSSFYKEISILGDYSQLNSCELEYMIEQKESSKVIEWTSMHNLFPGGLKEILMNKDLLRDMNYSGFSELLEIIDHGSVFSQGIIKAAEWIGEATKPDTIHAKFIKVAFAIDAMIGAEDENIPDKGKKSRIAERAAFLLFKKYNYRERTRKDMMILFGKRDEIAHGSKDTIITDYDLNTITKYARSILKRLLVVEPKFTSKQKIGEWVLKQSLLG
jgi:hypothetical protein